MRDLRTHGIRILSLAALVPLLLVGCGGDGTESFPISEGVLFQVIDSAGLGVPGATIYLVPASQVDGSLITGSDVRGGSAQDRDEPLEDAVRLRGGSFPRAVTGADGTVRMPDPPETSYYWFVQPAAGDAEHLPGGSGCQLARQSTSFANSDVTIVLSSSPPTTATTMGSSTCLGCHGAYATQAEHAHRLGLAVPGSFSALQDPRRYPDYEGNWDLFLEVAVPQDGTAVYFSDLDPTRGADKFKTSLTDPTALGETVYVIAWLWRDTADGQFKITLENVLNPADPGSPRTFRVPLTYGGAVFKQRNLLRVPGRRGLYPFLQWQSTGDDDRYSRTRRVFRDYHLDWFWDDSTRTLQDPPLDASFDGNCAACHFNGMRRFQVAATGEWLSDAVDDGGGVLDLDGDGTRDELNIGCEACHGPGSAHVGWASNPAHAGMQARYIVTPDNLSPSRSLLLCGRCHDRVVGRGPLANEEPLNPQGEMAPPGIGRARFLAEYTTVPGPAASDYWDDDLHSKSHQQHYADLLKGPKHRNGRVLVVCSDCHDAHGRAPFSAHLWHDPTDAGSPLCIQCHNFNHLDHMNAVTGTEHAGAATTCVRCHMTRTAQSGAGQEGLNRGATTGGPRDLELQYWQNDITSHLFLAVPRTTHPSVDGVQPDAAMPIPYTNSCGPCHDVSDLAPLPRSPAVAVAGLDQSVDWAVEVTLDGSGSYDPEGDPFTFAWIQTAGPAVTLIGADTATPAFTSPSEDTTLTFQLTVTDTDGSTSDTVDVEVASGGGGPPPPISYATDVHPIWASSGCTGCHGGAGGLTLSGAPADSYAQVTAGRVDTGNSAASLILTKPLDPAAGGVSHPTANWPSTGHPDYQTVLQWIEQGAQNN